MKKILLIPTLLTVASTPLISLVGCGEKDPETTGIKLTHYFTMPYFGEDCPCLRSEQSLDFNKDETYIALINASDFKKSDLSNRGLGFYIIDTEGQLEDTKFCNIATATVKVDEHFLILTKKEPWDLAQNEFIIRDDEGDVVVGPDTVLPNSKIEITFTVKEDVKQYYLTCESSPI